MTKKFLDSSEISKEPNSKGMGLNVLCFCGENGLDNFLKSEILQCKNKARSGKTKMDTIDPNFVKLRQI